MSKFDALEEVLTKRNLHRDVQAQNPYWFIERVMGRMVEMTAFEPDPNTTTLEYYYNAELNFLYKRIKKNGVYAWKKVSI